MTDRTTIAAMALQGLLSNPNQNTEVYDKGLADVAVGYADDLIRHLAVTAADAPPEAQDSASPSLRDLGVSGRAAAPLERMNVYTIGQLAVQNRDDIASVRGVSTQTMKLFDTLLEENGLGWDWSADQSAKTVSDDEVDDPLDDLEDVL